LSLFVLRNEGAHSNAIRAGAWIKGKARLRGGGFNAKGRDVKHDGFGEEESHLMESELSVR